MMPWRPVKTGWKWLNETIATVGQYLDARTMVPGEGISLNETPGGVTIAVKKSALQMDGEWVPISQAISEGRMVLTKPIATTDTGL